MSGQLNTLPSGLPEVPRDPEWDRDVAHEKLRAVLAVEQRGRFANGLVILLLVGAVIALPDPVMMLVAIVLRGISMVFTHWSLGRLRRLVEAREDYEKAFSLAMGGLFFGGATWALLLWPLMADPVFHPARGVIVAGVLLAAGSISAIICPVPRLAMSFGAGYIGILLIEIVMSPAEPIAQGIIIANSLVLVLLVLGWSLSGREHEAAMMRVENRRLNEELADSLAHAEFLAYRDPLTGLMNRRAFFESVGNRRRSAAIQLLLIDLDYFKTINDKHGHGVGDRVLVGVADAIRDVLANTSGKDHAAVRLGGEEFVVALDNPDADFASDVAENLRSAIEGVGVKLRRSGVQTSASIGTCVWKVGETLDDALARSDSALYRAKARGRNRVVRGKAE